MSVNFIRTITVGLGSSLDSQTVYTVPSNHTFICFKKKILGESSGYVVVTDGSWRNSVIDIGSESA